MRVCREGGVGGSEGDGWSPLPYSWLSSGGSDRSDGYEVVIDHVLIQMNLRHISDPSEEDGNSSDEEK